MEESQPRTPYKEEDEKEVEDTGLKRQEQSQIRPEEGQAEEQKHDFIAQLDEIQKHIKEDQERLIQISKEKTKLDVNSEEYIDLEDQRRILRKEIVDLDYKHKRIFKQYKKEQEETAKKEKEESARKQEQRIQQLRRAQQQQRLERSRRLQRQLQQISQQSKRRREEIQRLYRNPPKQEKNQEKQQQQIKESKEEKAQEQPVKEKTEQQKLAEERHKARVAQIQLQLASSRLRRSRQVELQAQLIRIRSYAPYHWWSHFSYPYYPSLYPYYRPSLYIDPLLYSRYRYSPYLYYYPLI